MKKTDRHLRPQLSIRPFFGHRRKSLKTLSMLALIGIATGCQMNPVREGATPPPAQHPSESKKSLPEGKISSTSPYDQPVTWPPAEGTVSTAEEEGSPPSDMIDKLGREFHIARHLEDHPSILKEVEIYQRYPTRLRNLLTRGKPFIYMIYTKVKQRNMPVELVLLPAVESSFNPFARSSQGAAGLWQFTYGTARVERIPMNRWYDGRLDPEVSTDAALDYLKKLYDRVGQDWLLALASYNAGIGNIFKAIERYRADHPDDEGYISFWDIEPYLPRETRRYVPQLMAIAKILRNPQAYEIAELPRIPIKPQIKRLAFKKQISLERARRYTGLPRTEFNRLNAGFKAAFTPPKGPHKLLLPVNKAHKLLVAYENKPGLLAVPRRHRHTIRFGETLYALAKKYGTSVRTIKRYNGLKSDRLRIGQTLWIPSGKGRYQASTSRRKTVVVSQNRQRTAVPLHTSKASGKHSQYYRIRQGDSLWSIARRFGMSARELARVNHLKPHATLVPGKKLLIPARYASRQVIHVVRNGDSLWKVARKYGVPESKVKKWNKLNSSTLHPGQKLTIWLSAK